MMLARPTGRRLAGRGVPYRAAGAGGARAVEHLRLVMAELMVATVRAQVPLSLHTDFENFTTFKPSLGARRRCTRCSISSSPEAVR